MKKKNTGLFLTAMVVVFSLIFLTFPKNQVSAQKTDGSTVFSNTKPITINTATGVTAPVAATNYPANITVSAMTGTVSRVEVSLRGLSHTSLSSLDLLLVGPGGEKFIFLSDALPSIQFNPIDGVFGFADDAPNTFPPQTAFYPGIYRPVNTNTGADTFPAPAPPAPYSATTFAQAFNGISPNGTWSLYVVEDSVGGTGGRIDSGWELKLTTDGAPQTFANPNPIALEGAIAKASPYASIINVSGLSGGITDLKVNLINLSHGRSSDVDILLVSPNGRSMVLMSDAGNTSGTTSVNNLNLSFSTAATTSVPFTPTSGTYRPTDYSTGGDFFPSPAPLYPYILNSFTLADFNNFNPNGEWKLFVVDDANGSAGMIAGGWSLEITTAPVVPIIPGCSAPSLSPTNYAVGANPTNLAVGDFNNDMKPDIVTANQVSNDVSILLNDANGGFQTQTTLTAGNNPYAVAVGLFNNDLNLDLAVVNSGSNNVSILLGNGDGTFSAPVNFATGASPISIEVGDFNNDSNLDLAIANFGGFFSGTVSILSGNGSGGFSLPKTLRTSTQPAFVKSALLNNDNFLDLIVANFGANTVSVYYGDGANNFSLVQTVSVPNGPVGLELADVVSNDGILDLLVAVYNSNTVRLYAGNANGTFTFNFAYTVGANPISVTTADILNNGTTRIAAAVSGQDKAAIQLPNSVAFTQVTVGSNPNGIVKADFNGDGRIDLATANSGSNNVSVLTNGCSAASGNIYDFNGDRLTDFGIFRPANGLWAVNPVLNAGLVFGRDRDIIAPADYNGDLKTDVAIYRPESGLWITVAPDLSTKAYHYIYFGTAEDIPMPADYDGDGKADIAVFRPSNGTWYIRKSSDNSLFVMAFGMNGDRPVAADYDGDKKADIAVFRPADGTWYIMGSQVGFFAKQFGLGTDRTVQGDYDGDGKADVAVFRNGDWFVSRSSDGAFFGQTWGFGSDIPVLGDYDGDGKYDLGVYRPSDGIWYILRSLDGAYIGFQYGIATDIPIPSAYSR